jgi:hypothetical protein
MKGSMKSKPELLTALVVTASALTVVAAPVVLTGVVLAYVLTLWARKKRL